MLVKEIKITKCFECPYYKIIRDPDPHDSFCYDDEALVCSKILKDSSKVNSKSIYAVDWQKYKAVDVGCRPYQIKNIKIPKWCPL